MLLMVAILGRGHKSSWCRETQLAVLASVSSAPPLLRMAFYSGDGTRPQIVLFSNQCCLFKAHGHVNSTCRVHSTVSHTLHTFRD